MKNLTKTIIVTLLALTVLTSLVSAEYISFCLGDGESIPITPTSFYSTSPDGRMICSQGFCTAHLNSGTGHVDICVLKVGDNLYNPPSLPGLCSGVCHTLHESVQPNLTLTVNWPFANGAVLSKTSFYLDIKTNLISGITLIDNVAGTQRRLCPNCKEYKRSAVFKEGFNDITIRAVKGDQILTNTISFFIDHKKPVISKTLPASNKFWQTALNLRVGTVWSSTLNATTGMPALTASSITPAKPAESIIFSAIPSYPSAIAWRTILA